MDDTVNIGLIGFRTIGSGVVETLNNNLFMVENKVGKKVNLKKVVDLDITTDRELKSHKIFFQLILMIYLKIQT